METRHSTTHSCSKMVRVFLRPGLPRNSRRKLKEPYRRGTESSTAPLVLSPQATAEFYSHLCQVVHLPEQKAKLARTACQTSSRHLSPTVGKYLIAASRVRQDGLSTAKIFS